MTARLHPLQDINAPGDDNDQSLGDRSDVGESIACSIGAAVSKPAHTFELGGLEREKHLGKARFDDRLLIGHGTTLE